MEKKLDGIKVAILATDGFEQGELFETKSRSKRRNKLIQPVCLRSIRKSIIYLNLNVYMSNIVWHADC